MAAIAIEKNMRRFVFALVLLSLFTVLLGGCKQQAPPAQILFPPVETHVSPGEGDDDFTLLMDELFAQWVSSDALTMNYFLAEPERLGIERPAPTFGEVATPETISRDIQDNKELYERLMGFRYEDLNYDQQIVYDILIRELALAHIMESEEDFAYFTGYIRPIDGIQVQLPILLAEFNFRSVADIETYLLLLEDTQRFFGEIIEFERERSRRGFFLSDYNADVIIENCRSFLENRQDNLLIDVFNDRIDSYEGLSDVQRDDFKKRNRKLVIGNVLPAYGALFKAMRELRGNGANQGGLSDLPGGMAYAAAYLKHKTGTDRTPEEVDALMEERMKSTLAHILSILRKNPEYIDGSESGAPWKFAGGAPDDYLVKLRKAIAADFPSIDGVRHVVREVHESLKAYVSPAFYLTPAIDRFEDNVIYINPPEIADDLSLFTILAHEGYPGHLYQTVYTLQRSPHPIRIALESLGYDEGWATYVEMMSYSYAGLPQPEAELMKCSKEYDLLFIGRIDLGVNALGWGIDDVASFCREVGITGSAEVGEIYESVIGNPLLYMPYALGKLEISMLRKEAEDVLKDDFVLLEFHRFILDIGSAPFALIRERMGVWMAAFAIDGR